MTAKIIKKFFLFNKYVDLLEVIDDFEGEVVVAVDLVKALRHRTMKKKG